MKPIHHLGETRTPDGARFSLHEHDGEYSLRYDGTQLMSSGWTFSEELLADEACRFKERPAVPRVIIGGLGLGFSLKRVLELVGGRAEVWVAELLPEVIEWNRKFLAHLNGPLLDDKRVRVHTGDVFDAIVGCGPGYFDAILLDVDNGPTSLVQPENARIYQWKGLASLYSALRPGGRVSFWAADPEPAFMRKLRKAGFDVEEVQAKSHERAKRAAHRIYTGERPGAKRKPGGRKRQGGGDRAGGKQKPRARKRPGAKRK